MIDVKELRIGNWVSNGEKKYTVDVNMLYDMATLEHYEMFPIVLTVDILLSCGFQKDEDDFYVLQKGRVTFSFEDRYSEGDFCLCIQADIGLTYFLIPNTCMADVYLHSFQNLYYDLLGEELIIKQ